MITVAELIEHLKTLPQDLPVSYTCCSDYSWLELRQIDVIPNTWRGTGEYATVVVRDTNGPREVRRMWLGREGVVKPISVVNFPGN